jgi:hypothetical protein
MEDGRWEMEDGNPKKVKSMAQNQVSLSVKMSLSHTAAKIINRCFNVFRSKTSAPRAHLCVHNSVTSTEVSALHILIS